MKNYADPYFKELREARDAYLNTHPYVLKFKRILLTNVKINDEIQIDLNTDIVSHNYTEEENQAKRSIILEWLERNGIKYYIHNSNIIIYFHNI